MCDRRASARHQAPPALANTLYSNANGAGKLEFEFTVPDNAAFFRVESQ